MAAAAGLPGVQVLSSGLQVPIGRLLYEKQSARRRASTQLQAAINEAVGPRLAAGLWKVKPAGEKHTPSAEPVRKRGAPAGPSGPAAQRGKRAKRS